MAPSGLTPEIQRDRDVERLAKKATLPPYMWDTLDSLSALARFMDAVRSEAGDARDAARYRWLRERKHVDIAAVWLLPVGITTPEQLDEAIDAAICARG